MLSAKDKLEKMKMEMEKLALKVEEEENGGGEVNCKEMCIAKYGFYHPDFNFIVKKDTVIIKVNSLSLQRVVGMLKGIEPLRYCTGDRTIYIGDRRIEDLDIDVIQQHLIAALKGEKITRADAEDAVRKCAIENKFDRLNDFFMNLDPENKNTNHLDTWLTTCFGVEDTEINRVIGKKFLVSAVARAMEPGCYVEGTLILYGAQGTGKSASCMSLAPIKDLYFGDIIDITNTQKACQTLQGKFMVEFSELASLNPKTIEDIKGWLTRKEDVYVAKYSNTATYVQRQFVCMGTTNSPTPLNDPSGNRRFWVVKVDDINLSHIRKIKDELWYEALQTYKMWTTEKYRQICFPRDPWVMTAKENDLLSISNKDFEVSSSITDWLKQNFAGFPSDYDGWTKYSDIKAAVSKFERVSDQRLSNILRLELGCDHRKISIGSQYRMIANNNKEIF